MATKLKKMQLTSVDLVRAGANQQADIRLFKSDAEPAEPPTTEEKNIFKRFLNWIRENPTEDDVTPDIDESPTDNYKNAITKSIQSIIEDDTLTTSEKNDMIEKSIGQYHARMLEMAEEMANSKSMSAEPSGEESKINERKENTMKIDKSIFTAEELAQYEALIAKAKVDPEAGEEEMMTEKAQNFRRKPAKPEEYFDPDFDDEEIEDEMNDEEEMGKSRCKKSVDPTLNAALARLATLEKSLAMKEFTEIAKKYAPLGENEEELAKTLYDMKQSNESTYNAYIGILDKSLGIINKSGLFAEIGKNTYGAPGGVIGKIEAAANEIQKSNAGMSREMAIAKAWEDHPELIAEYDAEYKA